jgi:hypothetical protein
MHAWSEKTSKRDSVNVVDLGIARMRHSELLSPG